MFGGRRGAGGAPRPRPGRDAPPGRLASGAVRPLAAAEVRRLAAAAPEPPPASRPGGSRQTWGRCVTPPRDRREPPDLGPTRDAASRRGPRSGILLECPLCAVPSSPSTAPRSCGKSWSGPPSPRRLGLRFLDTGLLYRALTVALPRARPGPDDGRPSRRSPPEVELGDGRGRQAGPRPGRRRGRRRTGSARPRVDRRVSAVARQPEVRAALLVRQRALAAEGGIVMAGRDIGTVVLPDADLKVCLDASPEERAARRVRERGLDPAGAGGGGDPRRPAAPRPRGREPHDRAGPPAADARSTSRPTAPLRADRGQRLSRSIAAAGAGDGPPGRRPPESPPMSRAPGHRPPDARGGAGRVQRCPADRLPWFIRRDAQSGADPGALLDPGHGRGPRARPAARRAHPRRQPHLATRTRRASPVLAHPGASGGRSTGWARRRCSTGRSSAGSCGERRRRHPAAAPPTWRPSGSPSPDPRRRAASWALPRGHPQPDRRAPGGQGRRRPARDAHRRADPPDRRHRHGPLLAAGPEALAASGGRITMRDRRAVRPRARRRTRRARRSRSRPSRRG